MCVVVIYVFNLFFNIYKFGATNVIIKLWNCVITVYPKEKFLLQFSSSKDTCMLIYIYIYISNLVFLNINPLWCVFVLDFISSILCVSVS